MIDPVQIHGKRLAMIAWGEKKEDGGEDVVVFTGTANWDGEKLIMLREPPHSSFQVPNEWWGRLKPVSEELKEMLLEADFYFSVTVGDLSEGEDVAGYIKTGLKWPLK